MLFATSFGGQRRKVDFVAQVTSALNQPHAAALRLDGARPQRTAHEDTELAWRNASERKQGASKEQAR